MSGGSDAQPGAASRRSDAAAGPLRCAVIGAGIAGLAAARALHDAGHTVRLFDKARGPGGRMATRRVDTGTFDHGAQYFTARSTAFRAVVRRWQAQKLVEAWPLQVIELAPDGQRCLRERTHPRFVGVPRMSALARSLGADLEVRFETRIDRMELSDGGVTLHDDRAVAAGDFDAVVLTTPLPQAAALLASARLPLPAVLARRTLHPCWAALVTLPHCQPGFDAVRLRDDPTLAWCAHDSGKPGRQTEAGVSHWILHATTEWSLRWLESDRATVADELTGQLRARLPELPSPLRAVAHRWRYARVAEQKDAGDARISLADGRIWLAGDGAAGASRVEDAWASGRHTALALLDALRAG